MASQQKQDYLVDLKSTFENHGYQARVGFQDRLGGDNLILTAKRGKDTFQVRMNKGAKSVLGDYAISIYATNQSVLTEAEVVNEECKRKTSFFNREKKQFHERLGKGVRTLVQNYDTFERKAGGKKALERKVSELMTDTRYSERLGALDFVCPAVGIEFDDDGIHPVFGLAVGGNHLGGLLLYDPVDSQVEVGGYAGFGGFGLGSVSEVGTPGEVLGLSSPATGFSSGSGIENLINSPSLHDSHQGCFDDCHMPDFGDCHMPDCHMPDCHLPDCDMPHGDLGDCDFDFD